MAQIRIGNIDFDTLARVIKKPVLDEPGEALFWTDPYISQQMLKTHLDPSTDAASRKPEIIQRSVDWMASQLRLEPGDRFLDLGCGPGLYAIRLARKGLDVTGIDFSSNSLAYARLQASQENLTLDYILQDYLSLDYESLFDSACLIYFDLGVFSKNSREHLLPRITRALKPGGHFIFDVVTETSRSDFHIESDWEVCPSGGFWRPGPYLVLIKHHHYPEDKAYLDRYLVSDDSGNLSIYNVWEHYFTSEMIQEELKKAGFSEVELWSDLTGTPYQERTGSIGVIATK